MQGSERAACGDGKVSLSESSDHEHRDLDALYWCRPKPDSGTMFKRIFGQGSGSGGGGGSSKPTGQPSAASTTRTVNAIQQLGEVRQQPGKIGGGDARETINWELTISCL